ncbi:MAG: hypothetical protein AB2A00_15270 [Myxococcota bacterium]
MPFQAVLMELCRSVPGARGAVFVDYEGESVQRAVLDPALGAYDLDVAGAHAAPIMAASVGCRVIRLVGHEGSTFIHAVKDNYSVVLVTQPGTLLPRAMWGLRHAAHRLKDLM